MRLQLSIATVRRVCLEVLRLLELIPVNTSTPAACAGPAAGPLCMSASSLKWNWRVLNSNVCAPQSHQWGQEEDWRPEADLWRGLRSWRLSGEWIHSVLHWGWGVETDVATLPAPTIKINESTLTPSWTLMYRHRVRLVNRNVFQCSWSLPLSSVYLRIRKAADIA